MKKQNNKIKIAAIVVTYNRKEYLVECIDSLLNQTQKLDKIYIIDNASTDGTTEYLNTKDILQKVEYIRLSKNMGGSGGFYYGLKKSYKIYDWVWMMDDDTAPKNNALISLTNTSVFNKKNTAVLASTKVDLDENIDSPSCKFNVKNLKAYPIQDTKLDIIPVDTTSFVGFMVNTKYVKKVGLPKKDFFIHCDDVEYSLRIRKRGGRIYWIRKSIIIHKIKHNKVKQTLPIESAWKNYYSTRNYFHISKEYNSKPFYYISILILLFRVIKSVIGITIFLDNKKRRITYPIRGFIDGIKGVKGKVI